MQSLKRESRIKYQLLIKKKKKNRIPNKKEYQKKILRWKVSVWIAKSSATEANQNKGKRKE